MRLALFDIDGTLIDGQHNIIAAMNAAMTSEGLDAPDPAAVRRVIGLSVEQCVQTLVPDESFEKTQSLIRRFKDAFSDLRASARFEEPLFDGVLETLRKLDREGWLLGVTTGKSRRGVDLLLNDLGLENLFVTRQTSDVNPSKPHPQMVKNAEREVGVAPGRTVMIGDTVFDMQMAANAGAFAVGVTWGYHSIGELKDAGADAIATGFRQLPTLLSDLVGGTTCARVFS